MKRPGFLALALLSVLVALAIPAAASDLSVDTLIAAQYSYGYFFAYGSAHGSAQIVDAHLLVNNNVPVYVEVEQYLSGPENNYGIWKFYAYASDVVKPTDTLTLVVTDINGTAARKQVVCVGSSKKKSDLTAACQ